MDLIRRIEELIIDSTLTTRAFATKCGINQPTLFRMLKGENHLNLKSVIAILDAFPEVSAEWLIRGEGQMFRDGDSVMPASEFNEMAEKLDKLVKTITLLQDVIDEKEKRISLLEDTIKQLKSK